MLRPGKHNDTTPSTPPPAPADLTMAELMEDAFLAEWSHFNPSLPIPSEKQLKGIRLMFVAVAQGVVQHLREHPEAFDVTTDSAGSGGASHTHNGEVSSISTTGTTA